MSKETLERTTTNAENKTHRFDNVGGEALIEGVMMRGPENVAMAIRKSDGTIAIENRPYKALAQRNRFIGLPVIRGMVGLFESMVIGVKALTFSAKMVDIDDMQTHPENSESAKGNSYETLKDSAIYISVVLAVGLGIVLFILLPNFIAGLIKLPGDNYKNAVIYNLIEGALRIIIFFGYIAAISKIKDIQRVFEYHGAEHKTIHCYEHDEELTVENIKKYPRLHPRCGTAFMLLVMIISILIFSFLGWPNLLARLCSRIVLIPLVAGLSYETIKYSAKSKSALMRIICLPGLGLQKFTTREPDESQIEIAIQALKNAVDGVK